MSSPFELIIEIPFGFNADMVCLVHFEVCVCAMCTYYREHPNATLSEILSVSADDVFVPVT